MLKRLAALAALFIGAAMAQDVQWTPVGAWPLCQIMPLSPWCPITPGSETFMLLIKASSPLPIAFAYTVDGIGIDGAPRQFKGIVERSNGWPEYVSVVLATGILRNVKITIRELTVTNEWSGASR